MPVLQPLRARQRAGAVYVESDPEVSEVYAHSTNKQTGHRGFPDCGGGQANSKPWSVPYYYYPADLELTAGAHNILAVPPAV